MASTGSPSMTIASCWAWWSSPVRVLETYRFCMRERTSDSPKRPRMSAISEGVRLWGCIMWSESGILLRQSKCIGG